MPPSRQESRRARRAAKRKIHPWRLALTLGGAGALVVLVAVGILVGHIMATLPPVTNIPPVAAGSIVYGASGQEIAQLHSVEDAQPVPLSAIPTNLRDAVIATEDASFYTNKGVDLRGIARAALYDLTGRGLQGASTISEQLGKMLFLHDNQSVQYKIEEVLLGVSLDRSYTKDQILDMYLNRLYLGQGAVGVGAASQIYFGKPVAQLDLPQAALIAGLGQAPSYYDPVVNPSGAKTRRNEVLQRMATVGYITAAQATQAENAPLELSQSASSGSVAYPDPWFIDAVINYLESKGFTSNQLFSGDLRIYTTLDPKVQNAAQNALTSVMDRVAAPPQGPQAAEVMMDPATGDVLAIVGGRDHPPGYLTVLDLATQGKFQTGSSIKPLAEYTDAIEHRDTAFSVIEDAPFLKHAGKWWPQNDNFIYQGVIPLEYALAISDNNASVRLELSGRVGIGSAWNTAVHQFGLPLSPADQTNASLGIGGLTVGVSPLEMADAYATFANNGVRPTPRLVREVVSNAGQVLFKDPVHATPELTPQVAYVMTTMMEAVLTYPGGTGYGQGIGRPAAGKTGTTSGGTEGWFCGYTPQLVGCAWEGYPTPTPQPGVYGATYALPIWHDTMVNSLAGVPIANFVRPPRIVTARVDVKSGLLPSPLTPAHDIATGYYIAGTQPTTISNAWVVDTVVRGDAHRLWTPGCTAQPTHQLFLKKPTDLVSGAPLPADSSLWPPTLVCGSGQATPPGGGNTTGPGTNNGQGNTPTGPSQPNQASATIVVSGGVAQPATVTVAQGAAGSLTVENRDPSAYVFDDVGLGVMVNLLPSQSTTIEFTPQTAGTYPFSLVGGQGTGVITVTAAGSAGGNGTPANTAAEGGPPGNGPGGNGPPGHGPGGNGPPGHGGGANGPHGPGGNGSQNQNQAG